MREIFRCCAGDSLSAQSGYQFSTQGADHDPRSDFDCAGFHRGAWWYGTNDAKSNLNGVYLNGGTTTDKYGIFWVTYSNTDLYSLTMTAMQLAP